MNLPINTDQFAILSTVEKLDSFYIISQTSDGNGFFESYPFKLKLGEYDIRLILHSNEYNHSKGKLYKLKVRD